MHLVDRNSSFTQHCAEYIFFVSTFTENELTTIESSKLYLRKRNDGRNGFKTRCHSDEVENDKYGKFTQ